MSTVQIGLAAALAVLLVLAWWALRRRDASRDERDADRIDTVIGWPPRATRVLSSPERMAFVTLVRAMPDHIVLAQVPLARFISVPKRNSYADWLRRVGYQSADFVICDTTSQVVAVVLDRGVVEVVLHGSVVCVRLAGEYVGILSRLDKPRHP